MQREVLQLDYKWVKFKMEATLDLVRACVHFQHYLKFHKKSLQIIRASGVTA